MALPIINYNGVESESRRELLDAHAHVWNHIFNFINSMSLKCAVELCIPDAIHKHGKPMRLSQLANALPLPINSKVKSDGLCRLMRILTHSNFFVKVKMISDDDDDEEEGYGYCLTPTSRLLLRNEPFSVAPFVLAMLDPVLIDPWHHVSEWFQNDDDCPSPYVTKHGMDVWEHFGIDERHNQIFNEAMASDARLVSNLLLTKECKHMFEGLRSMVDVGGGTGMLAKGIAHAFPDMNCIVLDLPHVVANANITNAGNNNFIYLSGDMFQSIPYADALLLKWILHDWNDEKCIKLLEKCKEAIILSKNNGGKLIIIEMIVAGDKKEEEEEHEHEVTKTKLFFDLMMMTLATGKERTENEWAKLFFVAGFSSYKITRLLGLRSVIEVFP